MDTLNYVAIDFETATKERHSICSVGIVTVINGIIMEKYFSLIQPPRNEYSNMCISIHGVTPDKTIAAPTFPEIYPEIQRRLKNKTIVAHTAKSVEFHCLNNAMQLYNIQEDLNITWVDTMDIDRRSLKIICEEFQIPLTHHDPLSDALACAEIYLRHNNTKDESAPRQNSHTKKEQKPIDPKYDNENNPFQGKRVVLTGEFISWSRRDDLHELMKTLGARVSSSVSGATNILIKGIFPGDTKLNKMKENIANGKDAIILNENEIIEMLSQCGIEYNIVDLSDESSMKSTSEYAVYNKKVTIDSRFDNEDNPFIKKRIALSGHFISWSDRERLRDLLELLGAIVSEHVSSATNILIAGLQAGDKKIEKMNENISKGKNAIILNENGIIEMLALCGFEYEKVDLPIANKSSLEETITLKQWSQTFQERYAKRLSEEENTQ